MNRKVAFLWSIFAFFCLGLVLTFSGVFLFLGVPAGGSRASPIPALFPPQETAPAATPALSAAPMQEGPAMQPAQYVSLLLIDGKSRAPLPAVSIFINGLFAGMTTESGTFAIPVTGPGQGSSTIRATREGYREITVQQDLSRPGEVTISLSPSDIIPVAVSSPKEPAITIVFLPSNTSFNATDNARVDLGGYPGGQQQFEADVRRFINTTFLEYPAVASPSYPLPGDYEKKFNFYYFWDGRTFGDAFDGCAGTIPQTYWDEVTSGDLTILLYPSYLGTYTGRSSQPVGCTNPNGLGRIYLKVPADMPTLSMHEIGHGLYGLMDTYCGDTYYVQNDPDPNLWSSEESCQEYARENSWSPDACRRVTSGVLGNCTKAFWRWDPDPDIMYYGYEGTFGNASTKRILDTLGRLQG